MPKQSQRDVMRAIWADARGDVPDEERSYFIARLPVHQRALVADVGAHDEAHDEAHDDVLLTPTEQRMLRCCGTSPRSAGQLLVDLGYKSRTGHFKKALTRLLDLGALERTLPDKPRSRKQQYRITTLGRSCLDAR